MPRQYIYIYLYCFNYQVLNRIKALTSRDVSNIPSTFQAPHETIRVSIRALLLAYKRASLLYCCFYYYTLINVIDPLLCCESSNNNNNNPVLIAGLEQYSTTHNYIFDMKEIFCFSFFFLIFLRLLLLLF